MASADRFPLSVVREVMIGLALLVLAACGQRLSPLETLDRMTTEPSSFAVGDRVEVAGMLLESHGSLEVCLGMTDSWPPQGDDTCVEVRGLALRGDGPDKVPGADRAMGTYWIDEVQRLACEVVDTDDFVIDCEHLGAAEI